MNEIDITEIDKVIDEYEEKNKINLLIDSPDNVELKYLNMSLDDLSKLTLENITNAIYILNRYALYVQRILNKNKAYERWALAKIEESASLHIEELKDMNLGWNERMLIAKNKPPMCQKLNKFLRIIRIKNDRMYDVPQSIYRIADSLRDIKFAKMQKEKHGV
jgi:hypothetical protein